MPRLWAGAKLLKYRMEPRTRTSLYRCCAAALMCAAAACAPRSTIYSTVVSNGAFVVGNASSKTGLFHQRGSAGIAWRHTGWDKVRAFGVAVDNSSKGERCYIAAGNGVHMTKDGGASWRITTDWRITEVLGVTLDQADPAVLYAATPYGVFKSTDGAATWAERNSGLAALPFTSGVVISRNTRAVLYAATEDGVYKSTDAAGSWTRLPLPVKGIRAIAQSPHDARTLAAGTEDDGIYMTRDGGQTWARSEAGLGHATFYALAFDPAAPAVLYAGGYLTGVYRSADGGASWERSTDGLTNLNIHSLAVDPADPERVYAASLGGGMFRSDDAGRHWRGAGLEGGQVWSVLAAPF